MGYRPRPPAPPPRPRRRRAWEAAAVLALLAACAASLLAGTYETALLGGCLVGGALFLLGRRVGRPPTPPRPAGVSTPPRPADVSTPPLAWPLAPRARDPEFERVEFRSASGAVRVVVGRCLHANPVDVLALDGERVDRLCLDCDARLGAW